MGRLRAALHVGLLSARSIARPIAAARRTRHAMSRSGRDQRRVLDVVEPKAPDEYAVPDRTPRQIQSDQNVIELPATQEAAAWVRLPIQEDIRVHTVSSSMSLLLHPKILKRVRTFSFLRDKKAARRQAVSVFMMSTCSEITPNPAILRSRAGSAIPTKDSRLVRKDGWISPNCEGDAPVNCPRAADVLIVTWDLRGEPK
jgi:hypothetical protein